MKSGPDEPGVRTAASVAAEIAEILEAAAKLAVRYYVLTGKPLGITGELGEYRAAHLLGFELVLARTPGFDVTDTGTGQRYQVKARAFESRAQRARRFVGQCIPKARPMCMAQ